MTSLMIKGLQKTTLIDYPEKVAATIFVGKCNFRCGFCYNKDLVLEYDKIPTISEKEILDFLKERKKWLDGVCMSIANTEQVLVKQKGVIKNIPIEDLWDEKSKTFYQNNFEFQTCRDSEAFTIGQKYLPLTKIIRHKTDKIYEVITDCGYRILTTGNHSVFVLTKSGLKPKKVEKLTKKDYLISPKKLEDSISIKKIDVLNYFEKELSKSKKEMLKRKKFWLNIIKDIKKSNLTFVKAAKKYGKERHIVSNYFKAYGKGNLEKLCYNSRPNLLWANKDFLYAGQNKVLPIKISISKEFIELLGYAVAEGSSSGKSYRFTLGDEKEFANKILKLFRAVFNSDSGIIQKTRNKTGNMQYTVIVGGRYIAAFFDKIVGKGASNKRTPDFIFNTPLKNKKIFFLAFHKGDGHTRMRKSNSVEEMSIKTISRKLASDLVILLRYFGVIALLNFEKAKGNKQGSYKVYFHGNQYSKLGLKKEVRVKYSFTTNIEGVPKELLGMEHLIKYEKQQRVNPNKVPKKYRKKVFKIAKKWNIIGIKKIKKKRFNNYVYDLVVRNDHSFVGGVGGFLLHNTGGEPTIHEELSEFIKKIKDIGLLVKLDTNGANPSMLRELIDKKLVDYVAMDIKGPLERYDEIAKVKVDKEKIKESANILMKSNVDYEFRTTCVPGLLGNDDFETIGKWLKGAKRYFLQQFKPDKKCIDESYADKKPLPTEKLEEFKKILYEYIGKVEIR